MNHKLKKWHIALMSFLALFIAVFASLFSLKADTVSNETEENQLKDLSADNWELSIVFYDSTVNNGNTPLTEINWDASDEGYGTGNTRVITMQINYKAKPQTTYTAKEIKIEIDNPLYSSSNAQFSTKRTVGANDSTHTGYPWNLSHSSDVLIFNNAETIEKDVNFEGSIQVVYEITPLAENSSSDIPQIEKYEDECTHSFNSEIEALLYTSHFYDAETFSTPGWPDKWPTEEGQVFEYVYENENAKTIRMTLDKNSQIRSLVIRLYTKKDQISPTNFFLTNDSEDKVVDYGTTYLKLTHTAEKRDIGSNGIFGKIQYTTNQIIHSNKITFDYTRTYKHPWQRAQYTLIKKAQPITSLDYLPNASDYTWINYNFSISTNVSTSNYPYIEASDFYVIDTFPLDCIVFDASTKTQLYSETGEYTINRNSFSKIIVGYPKAIYNEENQNTEITNIAQLYGKYASETENEYIDDGEVSLNLKDFEFNYSGSLYSVSKNAETWNYLKYEAITGQINNIAEKATNYATYYLSFSAKYTGEPMDIKIGDDLAFIYDDVNDFRKLSDNEYYISSFKMAPLYDAYSNLISYEADVYVRYANTTEYVLYGTYEGNKTIGFGNGQKVAAVYAIIKNVNSSVKTSTSSSSSWAVTMYFNKTDIEETGRIYNLCYLEVYIDDELVNPTTINNYSSISSRQFVAQYDLDTYGHYQQRAQDDSGYSKVTVYPMNNSVRAVKQINTTTQNAKDEYFLTSFTLTSGLMQYSVNEKKYHEELKELYTTENAFTGCIIYDLLPEGMELTSSKEDIKNSIKGRKPTSSEIRYAYESLLFDKDFNEITMEESIELMKECSSVEIIHNWRNSSRTMIIITVDMRDNLIMIKPSHLGTHYLYPTWTYGCKITYDALLEYGPTWTNYMYIERMNPNNIINTNSVSDNGYYENILFDINNNNNTTETLAYSKQNLTITSIVSSHQAVTTLVKTEYNNYTSDMADSPTDAEYTYKLRVNNASAPITNLRIYSNLEEAQQGKSRWKGEFLGVDTSYAEKQGYNVKTYYSENPQAGSLYDDNGNLRSEWKEFISPKYTNGLAITFNENCATYHSSDYLRIYYEYQGKIYISQQYSGTALAGQTIEIPSNDFYIYWYTNYSGNNAYGFSIDKIEPCITTNILGYVTSGLPYLEVIETTGTTYPESEHNPYKNSELTFWHYSAEPLLLTNPTDTSLAKSLAFEYLDNNGNAALLPVNTLTYVLIKMKAPTDENIKTLARMDCKTQWNALDEFDRPVDFITGINSNVVKVALPNSIKTDDIPTISLRFIKEIQGTNPEFENMKLDKIEPQLFVLRLTSLTANDNGLYNQVTAVLNSTQELIISQIPAGTYLLEELNDNYFNFIEFTDNNDSEIIINGVTLEQTNQGCIITISEDIAENIEFNIKVTNEIENERFYEDKNNKENLFLINRTNNEIENQ